MKCKKCGCLLHKSVVVSWKDITTKFKSPFLCDTCNDIEVWREIVNPFTVEYNGLNYWHCKVTPYNHHIQDFFDHIIENDNLLCEIEYTDGTKELVFPYSFKNDYIYSYSDTWYEGAVDTLHEPGEEHARIPINKINSLQQVYVHRDYYESDPAEPMIGYKGMTLLNGHLNDGYEVGVMKEEEKMPNPYAVDYQDCYLHYCENIEEPLLYWGRDYIADYLKEKHPGWPECRLYRVKAEGHYRQNTEHGWVANKLTPVEEVTREEIITYFESHPALIEKLRRCWERDKKPTDLWEQYKNMP